MPLVLEGLVTTPDADGKMHLAPMGPHVDRAMRRFLLRPFPTSQTYQNLLVHREGVLHVTDDVLLLARAAIGRVEPEPPHRPARQIRGFVLCDACRAFEFRVHSVDDSEPRVKIDCEVVQTESLRDFFGFNRAKHAVVEAAILATRVHLFSSEVIEGEWTRLAALVDKPGDEQE